MGANILYLGGDLDFKKNERFAQKFVTLQSVYAHALYEKARINTIKYNDTRYLGKNNKFEIVTKY